MISSVMPPNWRVRQVLISNAFGADYLLDLIHRAKLAPYREELLGLLEEWQEGDVALSVPLQRIEQLIDAGAPP